MEFERALFRVYERSVDGVLIEEDQDRAHEPLYTKSCRLFEYIVLGSSLFFVVCLIFLHSTVVGYAGCLPEALTYYNSTTNSTERVIIRSDTILGININSRALNINDDDAFHNINDGTRRLRGFFLLNTSIDSLPNYHYNFDYLVTFDRGVTFLSDAMKESHNFPTINITLSPYGDCYGGSTIDYLAPIGGVDTIVLNNVIYSTRTAGYMITRQGNFFKWSEHDLQPYTKVSEWIRYKLGILILSVLAFFFISTCTALLVRTLISSGIVIIFPIIWALQACGINALNLRIIAISYPWIGVPMQLIRSRHQAMEPFIIGHFTRAVLYYVLYIAAQNIFIEWFYAFNGVSGEVQLFLYAIVMLWEYFSMIYMRAAFSIMIFPRVTMALFVLFHIYFYSFPSGFHVLALSVMSLLSIALMVHCVRVYETKAYRLGHITIDQPRMLYNTLPWPIWRTDLAPDYTLFMPVTNIARGIYQNTVPQRPGEDPNMPPANDPNQPHLEGPAATRGGDLEMRNMQQQTATTGGPFGGFASMFHSWIPRRNNYESIQAHSSHNGQQPVMPSGEESRGVRNALHPQGDH